VGADADQRAQRLDLPRHPGRPDQPRFLAQLEALKAAGIAYDLTDERTLEEDGAIENGSASASARRPIAPHHRPRRQTPRRLAQVIGRQVGSPQRRDFIPPAPNHRERSLLPPSAAWKFRSRGPAPPENAWLLEPHAHGPGELHGGVQHRFRRRHQPALSLHFADDLVEATLDGRPLVLTSVGYDGTSPPSGLGRRQFTLRFPHRAQRPPGRPFVWLKGLHAAQRHALHGPAPTARCAPTVPLPPASSLGSRRRAGDRRRLPFMHQPLRAEATFTLVAPPRHACTFAGVQADALHLTIDGQPARLDLGTGLAAHASRAARRRPAPACRRTGAEHLQSRSVRTITTTATGTS
jgi:hypothetical protein